MYPSDHKISKVSNSETQSSCEAEQVFAANQSIHVRNCEGSDELRRSSSSSPGPVGIEAQQRFACQQAEKQYIIDFSQSRVRDNVMDSYPRLLLREVRFGLLLGRGTFGEVSECRGFTIPELGSRMLTKRQSVRIQQQEQNERNETMLSTSFHKALLKEFEDDDAAAMLATDLTPSIRLQEDAQKLEHSEQRRFLATHCWRESGESRYAIKSVKASVLADPKLLFQGILDLNVELRFLSSLPYHPNIIRLRGVSEGNRFDPRIFIILDRLTETLETRLKRWRLSADDVSTDQYHWNKCGCLPSFWKNKNTSNPSPTVLECKMQTINRLCLIFDLASATAHMHEHNIMHRDLKPSNMGFDIRGDVKIFDLGLAKEIPSDMSGPWHLTTVVGSPRYMAPEVALSRPYDQRCDVYSLALLMWEILSIEKPFENMTLKEIQRTVWEGATFCRPEVLLAEISSSISTDEDEQQMSNFLLNPKSGWTPTMKTIVEKSWSHNLHERPTMKKLESELMIEVSKGLKVIHETSGGLAEEFLCSKRLSHRNRRSTFVYQPDTDKESRPQRSGTLKS